MRHLLPFVVLLSMCITSCEGPVGPPGEDGLDGDSFVGVTFEFTGSFTASNNYELVFNFSENGYLPYESDVILVYLLWTTEDGYDYWRQLPQTVYFSSGAILNYNYDFTGDITNDALQDMAVFLEGDIDLSTLGSAYTLNQIFRVVVVPSDFLSADIEVSNIDNVLNAQNIEMQDLGTLKSK